MGVAISESYHTYSGLSSSLALCYLLHMVKMSGSVFRILRLCCSPRRDYWTQRLCTSTEVGDGETKPSTNQYDHVRTLLKSDSTRTVAKLKCGVCENPKQANTNLLNFLNQSDITKRKLNIRLPFFTAGSYLSVTRADPFSPRGESKFTGICIARRKVNTLGSTFTLRNVIDGIGVEMMFELYSPAIKEIKVLKLEKRRRAKLYYLRDKPPKYSTVKESMKPVPSHGRVAVYRRKPGEPA